MFESVGRLPEKYQLVVTLRFYKGMSYKEIADHLGEPQGTISNRIFRAINMLKEQFEAKQGAPLQ